MKPRLTPLFITLLIAVSSVLCATEKAENSKIHFENAFNELKEMLEAVAQNSSFQKRYRFVPQSKLGDCKNREA